MILIILISSLFAANEPNYYNIPFLRRVAVFPVADISSSASDELWWRVREVYTDRQRFVVASRRFMINRGVFTPQKNLSSADSIILGKILDTQILVTFFMEKNTLQMRVYLGESGSLLWESQEDTNPVIPIGEQIVSMGMRLTHEFIANLPFQGCQIPFDASDKNYDDRGSDRLTRIYLGTNHTVQKDDEVEWIAIKAQGPKALFSQVAAIEVNARGRVTRVFADSVEVKVDMLKNLNYLVENAMVRIPNESNRQKMRLPKRSRGTELGYEYLVTNLQTPEQLNKEHGVQSTFLTVLGQVALFILFAF